jgi:dephospho-CoA kinase
MNAKPLIVGLIGLAGAGKSTAARMIVNEYTFELIRLGDHIRDFLAKNGLAATPENERIAQVAIRQEYGMGALMRLSVPRIEKALLGGSNILIDSMCSFSEKEYLHHLKIDCALNVVAVHAPMGKRQLQLIGRSQRPLSYEQMAERDVLEVDQLEKGKLLALADHHLVNNDITDLFEEAVRSLMLKIGAIRRDVS